MLNMLIKDFDSERICSVYGETNLGFTYIQHVLNIVALCFYYFKTLQSQKH